MPKQPKIVMSPVVDGVMDVRLQNWKIFQRFITQKLLPYPGYAYRGQADSSWELETTLDRLRKKYGTILIDEKKHLSSFQFAARGRRNGYFSNLSENDWWSLGQHFGLATPLLDFTRSPYVALYFSFFEEINSEYRVVYAVHMHSITKLKNDLLEIDPNQQVVDIFTPMTEENQRLIAQSGLFVRVPQATSLEQWIKDKFKNKTDTAVLLKMRIPNRMRDDCLIYLNRSNINHLSLFPDLIGASAHANLQSVISRYDSLGYV